MTAGAEADRVTLIRRLSLDLIGLPPTPEQVTAFVNDQSPDAYERLVDRLLAFVNAGIHPIMPQKGSVGASGDLAPLSYLAAAIAGFEEAEVMYQGERMSAPEASGAPPDVIVAMRSSARSMRSIASWPSSAAGVSLPDMVPSALRAQSCVSSPQRLQRQA